MATRRTKKSWWARWVCCLVLWLALLLVVRSAKAQEVQISASVDADRVELGDTVSYSLRVTVSDNAMPSDPAPGRVAGFSVIGADSSPMQMHMNVNGRPSDMNSLVTTWLLRADKVGSFTLGPASATVKGMRRSASVLRVTVVPRGQGGSSRSRSPFDPFANNPLRSLLGTGREPERESLKPTADPKLNIDREPAKIAFLHATVDKTRAVLGEQITLSVYLYADPSVGGFRVADVHEATANDFVKRSLIDDETRTIDLGMALVGSRPWGVKLVRKSALFALKTGRLEIEPMSLAILGFRTEQQRQTEPLHVEVTEPPAVGRPPGYSLGDVGDFALAATVSPRSVEQGGAVGVTLEVRGTGNIPEKLVLPVVEGVEWLDASSQDKLGATQSDRFGGTRTFSYVVRLHKPGAIDLGEVRLPYYDADRRNYSVARASLGIVDVKPGQERSAADPETERLLANLPLLRTTLEGQSTVSYLSDRAWFWALVFGLPIACTSTLGALAMVRKARERRADRTPSPHRVAKARRADAKAACEGSDAKAALGAIVRAIHAVVVAETGVNLRGASTTAARTELAGAGANDAAAKGVLDVLRACEDAQFSPDGVAMASVREIWTRAEDAMARLGNEVD
ncbi:MAG: BatD family protein [Polyangiaceae bacterium]|nr:BatD family protein [Polyangiaceae bacterium]